MYAMKATRLNDDRLEGDPDPAAGTEGAPQVPIPLVAQALRATYGLEIAAAQPTGGELDLNLRAQTTQGVFLVKVSAPQGAVETWRDRILTHLALVAPALPVPRIVPTREGAVSALFEDGGRTWQLRVYGWLDGDLLAHSHPTTDLLHDLGRTSAELTEALASFEDTSMTSHAWDLRTARETLLASLPYVTSAPRAEAARRILGTLENVRPVLGRLPVATVHHDLNDFNVLVVTAADGRQRIAGILDFNDALQTYRVADVAIAAGYAMLRQDTPVDAAAAVVSGYYAHTALDEDELEVVFPLAAIRLCLNATVWTRRTSELEDTVAAGYGRRRMADTWPMVERLSRVDARWARDRIRRECGLT